MTFNRRRLDPPANLVGNKGAQRYFEALHDQLRSLSPIGCLIEWDDALPVPEGFLRADGAAVSRKGYADLFTVYGVTYGAGDGSSTFNIRTAANRIIPTR